MPYSSEEGKALVKEFFVNKKLADIIDVGPGSGTYWNLMHGDHPESYWWAVEIWPPYIEQFSLKSKYDVVVVADARWFDWRKIGHVDLIILGDILEHMDWDDAGLLLWEAYRHADYVVVSTPIIEYPQGAHEGNPYEAHVSTWDASTFQEGVLTDYTVLAYYEGQVTGTYIIEGDKEETEEVIAF